MWTARFFSRYTPVLRHGLSPQASSVPKISARYRTRPAPRPWLTKEADCDTILRKWITNGRLSDADRSVLGHTDPVSRNGVRRSLCLFHEKHAERPCTARADGLCRRRHGRGFRLEPAHSGARPSGNEPRQMVVRTCGHRLLGGHSVPAAARSRHSPSAPQQRDDGGAEKPSCKDDHDGACGHAA